MHETHNDLPVSTRSQMVELLQAQLADTVDLTTQVQHAHWNVRGPHFIAYHELFGRLYEELGPIIDMIGERTANLGGQPSPTVRRVAASSRLEEYPADVSAGDKTIAVLGDRYGAVAASTRAATTAATDAGDDDTADLFTEVSRLLDQHLWLIEAHED